MLENLPAVSLVNAAFVLPIGIWILKGVFDAVPREIREAALVDGCDELSVLWRIVVPLSLPGTGRRRRGRVLLRLERVSVHLDDVDHRRRCARRRSAWRRCAR